MLNEGEIVEEGQPFRLLAANVSDEEVTGNGYFAEMVKNCGLDNSREIFREAKKKFLGTGNLSKSKSTILKFFE